MRISLKGFLAAALLALLFAGCAAPLKEAPPPVATRPAAIVQAEALAREGAALTGQARIDNTRQIAQLIATLDDATLQHEAAALPATDALYKHLGRALLARGLPLPKPFARTGLQFDNRPPALADGYRPPVKLALLLPQSGPAAAAAQSVRDGFLAGYYGESRRRPEINFYNTAEGVQAAYDRAVADGNDYVVGPLAREDVDVLFAKEELPVPVLALNRGSRTVPDGSTSFSLSPEDEGIAAANVLLDRGAKRVLAIGGGDDTQRRVVAAFRDTFTARGGKVIDVVPETTTDFTAIAQKDGGADGVLLAMKGSVARTLAPALTAAGLSAKPRVASSAILSGTGKPADDVALDGIAYPTEAWGLRDVAGLPSAATAATRIATARGPAARLFAFGFDAWRVAAYLESMATSSVALDGATGQLRMDGFGNIVRTPAWATFRGGVSMPLPNAR